MRQNGAGPIHGEPPTQQAAVPGAPGLGQARRPQRLAIPTERDGNHPRDERADHVERARRGRGEIHQQQLAELAQLLGQRVGEVFDLAKGYPLGRAEEETVVGAPPGTLMQQQVIVGAGDLVRRGRSPSARP